MAKVTVSAGSKKKIPRVSTRRASTERIDIELPTEYELPCGSLNDFSLLIHGEKKIGKTSLSLETEDPDDRVLLLQHDPSQKTLRRLEIRIPSWSHFLATLKKLEHAAEIGKFPYVRTVLDRADIWFRNCQNCICDKLAIDHPSDEKWGIGWDAVRQEFSHGLDRLLNLPGGKWFLCHSSWKETETREGETIDRLVPNLTKTAEEVLNGQVDAWFAYDYTGTDRVLCLQGSDRIGAGHRINGHFLTTEKKPIRTLYMGKSEREAYRQLVKAFNNKIETRKHKVI